MKPLYEEKYPDYFGTVPDRHRGPDQVYEFGSINGLYTMVAASDKVAICALIMITGGRNGYIFYYPETALQPPMMFNDNHDEYFKKLFGDAPHQFDNIGKFMALHYDAVLDCLDTVLVGGRQERASVMETVNMMGFDAVQIAAYLKHWDDMRTGACLNLRDTALDARAALTEQRDVNLAGHEAFLEQWKAGKCK